MSKFGDLINGVTVEPTVVETPVVELSLIHI